MRWSEFWKQFKTMTQQCDQIVNLFFHNMAIHDDEYSPNVSKICPKLSQILNKPSKYCQTIHFICPNGEISPNLFTLMMSVGRECSVKLGRKGQNIRAKVCTYNLTLKKLGRKQCDQIGLFLKDFGHKFLAKWNHNNG